MIRLADLTGRAADPSRGPLIWWGLDYSKVKTIGTADFRKPDEIFPGMLDAWKGLFMKEMLPKLEKMATPVGNNLDAVAEPNAKASASQIEHTDGTKDETRNPK